MESVYPDDLIILGEEISKRTVDKLLMDLSIATNPHLGEGDAKKLQESLMDKRRQLWGPDEHGDKLDLQALESLKTQLKNNSRAIKVK